MKKSSVAMLVLITGGLVAVAGSAGSIFPILQKQAAEDTASDNIPGNTGQIDDRVNNSIDQLGNHTVKPIGQIEDRINKPLGQFDNRINKHL